jgi:hypothetical protein
MVPFPSTQLLKLLVVPAYPDLTYEESKIGWPATKKNQMVHHMQLVELWWSRWPLETMIFQTKRNMS